MSRDGYRISTDPAELDLDAIHDFLKTAYWSTGVPREVVQRSIESSLNFGLYTDAGDQVGFTRVVTDYATFAWIADVYVLPGHRGHGLGVWLMEAVMSHPDLKGIRRHLLATADAHGLYERFGFEPIAGSDRFMVVERDPREIYGGSAGTPPPRAHPS